MRQKSERHQNAACRQAPIASTAILNYATAPYVIQLLETILCQFDGIGG